MRLGSAVFALTQWMTCAAGAEDAPAAPLWANLAECSAVFSATAQADGYSGADPDLMAQAASLAARFHDQSILAATKAGQSDAESDVASIMDYLVPRWQNRINDVSALRTNLDWIDYCRRLGLDQGLLPLAQ